MFESQTYNTILSRMLGRVPLNIDKREGSVIYNALAPAALELSQMYTDLEQVLNETFADTASRFYLVKRAKERGVYPESPTYAVLKGVFDCEVPVGSRFAGNNQKYTVTERIGAGYDYIYRLQCETVGAAGNEYTGPLIPIEPIDGLKSATLTEIIIHGEEAESTESFRQRYFASITSQAFGGNVADYLEKLKSLQDVGGGRVYPVWNGGGTVKIVFVNSEYDVPSKELVDYVQENFDPLEYTGQGVGLAPIGHTVTVEGALADTVDITVACTCGKSYVWEDVKDAVSDVITGYFREINSAWSNWEDSTSIIVRISQLESRILTVNGVVDVSATKINGLEKNHDVPANAVVRLGALVNVTA